ncbi:MAG TPA: hypothetical protein VKY29_02790 [Cryomorphaceae bacterium]|nr:hypothetical protein [Cryomorphaceae bacterium]
MSTTRMELIEEMLEKNPEDTYLNFAAALEYKKQGSLKKALATFRKIIKLDPNYLPTYYQVGSLLESFDRVDEAITVYRKGLELAQERKDVTAVGELSEALLILDEDIGQPW